MTELKTRRGLTLYAENPFLSAIETRKKPVFSKTKDMCLLNHDTGEIANFGGFTTYEEVSSEKFVQLFIQGVKALTKLNSAGVKIFSLLYDAVQGSVGKHKIYMCYSALKSEATTISKTTYDRGVRDLIEKQFIAPSDLMGWYWINPQYLYNGDRLRIVKEYRKVSATVETKPLPAEQTL